MTTQTITHSTARAELVCWMARVGAITAEALAARIECSLASARAQLLACKRAGLLSRTRPLTGAPSLYALTRAGIRAAGVQGLEPSRVSAANARHSIICAEVAVALERAYPGHRLIGEQRLREEERAQGGALASARVPGALGAPGVHRPDLVLCPAGSRSGQPVAVEVELTVKGPHRLVAICRGWARAGCVAGVIYLAAPEVLGALERAIAAAQASPKVLALPLEAILTSAEPDKERVISRAVPGDA